jgi:hypothetical protein
LARNRSAQRWTSFLFRGRWPRAPAYALAAPSPPAASRSAFSGGRDVRVGAGTLPARAMGSLVPVERQFGIPSRAVIGRFPNARRPAGTPLPNVRASLRRKGATPRPKKQTARARLVSGYASRQACEAGPTPSRDSALPAKTRPPLSRRPSSGYGSQSKGHCEPVPPDDSDTAACFGA